MSNTQIKVVLGAVVVSGWALLACTAGVGSPVDIGSSYGDDPGSFGTADKPNGSQDAPRAPSGGNASGTSGGNGQQPGGEDGSGNNNSSGNSSGGTAGGDCPPCDGNVTCDVTANGQSSKATLPLKTKSGNCVAETEGGDIVVACGGALTQNGNNVGTWKNCTKADDAPSADAGTKG
jgi:hypothetical protein